MAFQDDDREEEARKLFNLKKPDTGRSGTDAVSPEKLKQFDSSKSKIIEFELKTVGTGKGVTTVRDFGPDHIKKWKKKYWIIGVYKKNILQYYHVGTPNDMKPWIKEKEEYIEKDFELAKLTPKKISKNDLFSLLGKKEKYSYEDAKELHKRQYTKSEYEELMDLDEGYSPEKMLEILKDRIKYLIERGSTLNNPHIPPDVYTKFPIIKKNYASELRHLIETRK